MLEMVRCLDSTHLIVKKQNLDALLQKSILTSIKSQKVMALIKCLGNVQINYSEKDAYISNGSHSCDDFVKIDFYEKDMNIFVEQEHINCQSHSDIITSQGHIHQT